MSEEIKSIKQWFEQAVPEPTIETACVQIGCHYEEVAEMANATCDFIYEDEILELAEMYKSKSPEYIKLIKKLKGREDLLDSLCDQIVTAIGVAHMLGMDIEGALNEVNDSNYSKFEGGKPVFNEQGKIAKGKDYFSPDLSKFV